MILFKSTLCDSVLQCLSAAGRHGLLLRADEVHHRGPGAAELRAEEGLQREVSEAENATSMSLQFPGWSNRIEGTRCG